MDVTGEAAAPAGDVSQTSPAPNGSGDRTAEQAPYETLGEDDQIIEDLKREHKAKVAAEPSPPAKPSKAPAAKPKAGKAKAEPEAPAAAPEAAQGSALVKYGTPKEAIDAIVLAIDSGDPKKIAKALGKPDGYLDSSNAKWVAFREQQSAIRQRDRDLTEREHRYNEGMAAARKEFGTAIGAAKAYRDGDLKQFVTLIQELTGERYDDAQRKVISGELAIDPGMKALRSEIAELRAERAKERAEADKAQQERDRATQYERAVEAVTEELAGHRVTKLKGFQRDVLTRVRDSYDPSEKTYTLSFHEAADAIMAERDAEAEALGYSRAAPALPAAPSPRSVIPPRSQATDARPPDGEPWMVSDLTDDEILEGIARDIKSGKLKA